MQLVLGVSVAEATARLALVDVSAPDAVIDQFDIDLASAPADTLRSTIVGTDRSLSDSGHRLAGTRISWVDDGQAAELQQALTLAGMTRVAVVSPSDAATAFVRGSATGSGYQTSALLFVNDNTAALSVVGADAAETSVVAAEPIGADGPESACTALLDRLREEPGGAQGLYVVGTSGDMTALARAIGATSPIPVQSVDSPAFAIARGATLATVAAEAGSATASAATFDTSPGPQIGENLAYSMAPDSDSMAVGYSGGYGQYGSEVPMQSSMAPLSHADDPDEAEEAPVPVTPAGRPRILLVGSTIAAAIVVGFAALAVVIAISIQPAATQQAIRDYEAVPGKYLPVMPGQGTVPVEDAAVYLPPVVPVAPVAQTLPASGGGPVVASGGSRGGTYSPSSGGPAGSGGGTQTVFVMPSAGGGAGTVVTPLPNAFRLSDWLPSGMNFDLGGLFTKTQVCELGDVACVYRATGGCLPGSPDFGPCIEERFPCTILCGKTETIKAPADCAKSTDPDCKDESVPLTSNTDCPSGATCAPLKPDNQLAAPSDTDSSTTGTEATAGSEEGQETRTDPETSSPGPTTTTVTRPSDEPTTSTIPSETSPTETPPSEAPKPPAEGPKPPSEEPKPPSVASPAPVTSAEPPVVEEAPAPPPVVVEEAPAPPPVVEEAPAPAPVVEAPAPAPVVEAPAPPPVVQAPVVTPSEPSRSDSGSSSSSSDSSPTTTVVETPEE